jgi:DNA-binding NarL/FixJ family response regulator
MNKIRVMVVDDHPFFRTGIVQWLNQQDQLTSCGEAGSVAEARSRIAELRPEVILMDLRLGDGDGLDLIRELTESHPQTRIIALSQFDEDAYAHRALRAGARGYLMKSEATENVLAAIQATLRGETYVSRRASARLMQNLFPDPACSAPDLARLSDREIQVFQLLGSGSSTREIAERLKISPKTVETYREHLTEKLHLPDGATLLRAATLWVEKGRLDPTSAKDDARKS